MFCSPAQVITAPLCVGWRRTQTWKWGRGETGERGSEKKRECVFILLSNPVPEDSSPSDCMAPFWITYVLASRVGLCIKMIPSWRKPYESKNFGMAVPWQMDLVALVETTFPPQYYRVSILHVTLLNLLQKTVEVPPENKKILFLE